MSGAQLLLAFGAPFGLLLALAAVPIIVAFLLKRRHREVEVSSTLLWSTLMQDVLARAPFRRPSEWLSLALLVLAVIAAALAAAALSLGRKEVDHAALVIVLDVSASMATTTGEQGTRFDEARARAREAIASARLATIIAAAEQPRLVCHQSTDREAMDALLRDLAPAPVEGRLAAALRLAVADAVALRHDGAVPRILVFADFATDRDELYEIDPDGVPLALVRCGEEVDNCGIVHAAVSPAGDGGRLLVTLAARGAVAHRTLLLYCDERLVDAREVTVDAARDHAEVFAVTAAQDGADARYRVALEPADSLVLDDTLCVGVGAREPPRVLHIGDEDPFIERLPRTFPGLSLQRVGADSFAADPGGPPESFDLAIVTASLPPGCVPDARHELYLGCEPDGLGITLGAAAAQPSVLDWDRTAPLLHDVGFDNLLLLACRPLAPADGVAGLLRTTAGIQLAHLPGLDRDVLVWASGMHETNFALLPAFPLLLRNLLGGSLAGVAAALRPAAGALHVRAGADRLGGTVVASLTSPSGEVQSRTLWAREELFWDGALEPGFYTLRSRAEQGGAPPVERQIGVALLSRAESVTAIATPDAGAFVRGGEVSAMSVTEFRSERPVWRSLLWIALLLLTVEALVWARPPWRRQPIA